MKTCLLTALVALFSTAITYANPPAVAESCNFEMMRESALSGLRSAIVLALKEAEPSPIAVRSEDILIEDKGAYVFQEDARYPSVTEHAFAVSFKSPSLAPMIAFSAYEILGDFCERGVPVAAEPYVGKNPLPWSAWMGKRCFRRPAEFWVSIPDPIRTANYDSAGRAREEFCVVKLYTKYNRNLVFMNPNTQAIVQSGYAPHLGVIATMKIPPGTEH